MELLLVLLLQAIPPERFLLTRANPTPAGPRTQQAVAPLFPEALRDSTTPVAVVLEVEVDDQGRVVRARAVEEGNAAALEAAFGAVYQWQFGSRDVGGAKQPIKLVFVFRTMPVGTPADELTTIFRDKYEVEVRAVRRPRGPAK
jgi:hypothetical protein